MPTDKKAEQDAKDAQRAKDGLPDLSHARKSLNEGGGVILPDGRIVTSHDDLDEYEASQNPDAFAERQTTTQLIAQQQADLKLLEQKMADQQAENRRLVDELSKLNVQKNLSAEQQKAADAAKKNEGN
jgi:hypothetical protein